MELDTVGTAGRMLNRSKIVVKARPSALLVKRRDTVVGNRRNEHVFAASALERELLELEIHPRDEARRVICHALLGKAAGKFLIGRRGIPSHPIGVDGIIGDDLEQLVVEATGPLISTV